MISFGLPISAASYVFVLPNPPKGPFILDAEGHGEGLTAQDIILLNGNHWRKILTIAAKLVCPIADWRVFRDTELLATVTVCFSPPAELMDGTVYFFCGQQVQQWSAPLLADVVRKTLDEESRLQVFDNVIYCPYLDYRQYPNALIDCTRCYLQLAHIR